MHNLIGSLRREYQDVEQNIENDLVELELGNMDLHPKMKNFEVKQSAASESIHNLLSKIEDSLQQIFATSSPSHSVELSQPVRMLTSVVDDLNN